MQLGDLHLTCVSGGRLRSDGGTMFGVVPKALWQRVAEPDEQNRILLETNCLLVRGPGFTALIDTGYGSKLSERQRRIHAIAGGDPLVENLARAGVSPEGIDTVILTHLHFDHAGGATRYQDGPPPAAASPAPSPQPPPPGGTPSPQPSPPGGEGRVRGSPRSKIVPTFPRARYIVQRVEWETATSAAPEYSGAYPLENIVPLEEAGRVEFIDGDVEILPGVRALATGGHTRGHQALLLEGGGRAVLYPCDLAPTTGHLHSHWSMAYDQDPLETRRRKPELLGRAADEGWLVVWCHDPEVAASRVRRDAERQFAVEGPLTEEGFNAPEGRRQ